LGELLEQLDKSLLGKTLNNINISVIIPTYNRGKLIVQCIDSVLNQSYPVNEIIVIDDNSTDDTTKRLNKFKENVIVLKTEKQSGAQTARNIGIKAAKSDWIAFLDSDDEWLPNKIEKQVSALKIVNYDPWTVVHGDCFTRNIYSDKKNNWQLDHLNGKNVYKQLLSKSNTFFPAILTSKNALVKINYLDENAPSYHEWDTSIGLAKFCRFIHIEEPLFNYNIHQNSISKNSDKSILGYQYIINKFKDEIIELCGEDVFTNHLFINSIMALNNGKNNLGRTLLKQISNNSFKKYFLQLFSYLGIKPIYFIKIKQFIVRKK